MRPKKKKERFIMLAVLIEHTTCTYTQTSVKDANEREVNGDS